MLLQRRALWAACACALLSAPSPALASESRVSWYGAEHGQARNRTACGERFRPGAVLVAHWTLPCGTRVRITDRLTGRSIEADVRDRGPRPDTGRHFDMSLGAARRLGPSVVRRGVISADVTVLAVPRRRRAR